MIKPDSKKKYFFGFLLVAGVALSSYYVLKTNTENEEIALSPSSSDELSDEKLKIALDAAQKNDMAATSDLVWHYCSVMSYKEEFRKDCEYWMSVLKNAARAGNTEAKKHFLDGNPD